ncbi:protein tyrosine phosphatase family protein [Rivibacter subsaxonicus]|uniref:Protein tyrosine phosphatase (PTP) superfamily phosphohydrolase (DUF442 family) n=1 Tax=Rivibacter subsaxonicus TaxID=457575 RepID=A0A4Q7W159_9BURK|nr:protein tyrosine phosphatase family protein [Rivibacter subsaxonicus]RZU02638.1 protein tyrosine phosphatase (PTP) superfamily phosphohydrolase (DUF442 family) [Rivibacter subsaxonicus]
MARAARVTARTTSTTTERRRALLGLLLGLAAAGACQAATPAPPPNLVQISTRLVTSGQPSAAWLQTLREQGFDAVIYLAPPTVADAVAQEPAIVKAQGLVYRNLPIDFQRPSSRDVDEFVRLMDGLSGRKVLVHCQVNMRASAMVFLYRATRLREDPQQAYEAVTRVWSPSAAWQRLLRDELQIHRVDFEPF